MWREEEAKPDPHATKDPRWTSRQIRGRMILSSKNNLKENRWWVQIQHPPDLVRVPWLADTFRRRAIPPTEPRPSRSPPSWSATGRTRSRTATTSRCWCTGRSVSCRRPRCSSVCRRCTRTTTWSWATRRGSSWKSCSKSKWCWSWQNRRNSAGCIQVPV